MQTNLWTTLLLFITTSVMFTTTAAQGTGALPEATISPASQAIRSGAAATFTCIISPPGTSVLSVTWLHNGTSLPPTDARFSTSNLELTISNLSEDLAGNYTCVVANSVGIVSSSVAELQIAFYEVNVFSSDEDAPYEINVTAGQPTAIDCVTYTSNALVRLMWNVIDSGVRHQISDFDRATAGQNGSLYLLNPMLRDDGNVYTCNVFIQEFNIVLNGYVKILVQGKSAS